MDGEPGDKFGASAGGASVSADVFRASGKEKIASDTSESLVIVEEMDIPEIIDATDENEDEQDKDSDMYSDDFDEESGVETDIDDSDMARWEGVWRQRPDNPVLPDTVTRLDTPWGSKVYLVGTAHFSLDSQQDVAQTIVATQPDVVMVELCHARVNILQLDEQTLLQEAKDMSLQKVRLAIKQSGLVQGILHLLFLSLSAHLTKELGMAPGGEFRTAFREVYNGATIVINAIGCLSFPIITGVYDIHYCRNKQAKKIPGCQVQLGDRPINITLQRALSALSVWQKAKLAWCLITSNDPISKDDVERCKQKDLLEEMLREMTGEFPALSRTFISERDTFLAYSLKHSAQPLPHPDSTLYPDEVLPSVVVGVVGMGHVSGIVSNWDRPQCDLEEIMQLPTGGTVGRVWRICFRLSLLGIVSLACYKLYKTYT